MVKIKEIQLNVNVVPFHFQECTNLLQLDIFVRRTLKYKVKDVVAMGIWQFA